MSHLLPPEDDWQHLIEKRSGRDRRKALPLDPQPPNGKERRKTTRRKEDRPEDTRPPRQR